jgi:hypothetical protein
MAQSDVSGNTHARQVTKVCRHWPTVHTLASEGGLLSIDCYMGFVSSSPVCNLWRLRRAVSRPQIQDGRIIYRSQRMFTAQRRGRHRIISVQYLWHSKLPGLPTLKPQTSITPPSSSHPIPHTPVTPELSTQLSAGTSTRSTSLYITVYISYPPLRSLGTGISHGGSLRPAARDQ